MERPRSRLFQDNSLALYIAGFTFIERWMTVALMDGTLIIPLLSVLLVLTFEAINTTARQNISLKDMFRIRNINIFLWNINIFLWSFKLSLSLINRPNVASPVLQTALLHTPWVTDIISLKIFETPKQLEQSWNFHKIFLPTSTVLNVEQYYYYFFFLLCKQVEIFFKVFE